MGYGVEEQYITEVDRFQCNGEKDIIHIWTEPQHSQEEIDKFIEDAEYFNNKILANKN